MPINNKDVVLAWFRHKNLQNRYLESDLGKLYFYNKHGEPTLLGFYKGGTDQFCVYNLGDREITHYNHSKNKSYSVYGQQLQYLNFNNYFTLFKQIELEHYSEYGHKLIYVPTKNLEFKTAVYNNDLVMMDDCLQDIGKLSTEDILYFLASSSEQAFNQLNDYFLNSRSQKVLFALDKLDELIYNEVPVERIEKVIDIFLEKYFVNVLEPVYAASSHYTKNNSIITKKYLDLFFSKYIQPNDSFPDSGNTVLSRIISRFDYFEKHYLERIKLLLKYGCDPYYILPNTDIPFWFDIVATNQVPNSFLKSIYTNFKKNKIDINKTDKWNRNILHLITNQEREDKTEIFEFLTKLGIDSDHRALIDDQQEVIIAKMKGILPEEYGKTPRELL